MPDISGLNLKLNHWNWKTLGTEISSWAAFPLDGSFFAAGLGLAYSGAGLLNGL
jgi:hypothetical protein